MKCPSSDACSSSVSSSVFNIIRVEVDPMQNVIILSWNMK